MTPHDVLNLWLLIYDPFVWGYVGIRMSSFGEKERKLLFYGSSTAKGLQRQDVVDNSLGVARPCIPSRSLLTHMVYL